MIMTHHNSFSLTLHCVQWLSAAVMLSACGGQGGNTEGASVGVAAGSNTSTTAASPETGPPGGTLVLRIAGTQAGVTHDVLAVAGNAELAGTLSLEFTDGYVPPAGQRFAVIRATSFTGAFASVTSTPSRSLTTSRDTTNFYVTVGQ